jgi:putative restriction endonuclease
LFRINRKFWQSFAMPARKPWTRDELLVLLNLYEKIPFGHFDQAQPVIRDMAKRLDRTPGSVAMKLCNLASLDPAVKARGRKGLTGASNLDREMWADFQARRNILAPQSEEAFHNLFAAQETDEVELVKDVGVRVRKTPTAPEGPTEVTAGVNVRRGQQFFRQMVLNAFDGQCCVTGVHVRDLLIASHILPWKPFPKERLDPQNGLCLSRLHDGAFDCGLITFDEKYQLVLSKELRKHLPQPTIEYNFAGFAGKQIRLHSKMLPPKQEYLSYHRKTIFRG